MRWSTTRQASPAHALDSHRASPHAASAEGTQPKLKMHVYCMLCFSAQAQERGCYAPDVVRIDDRAADAAKP